MRRQDASWGAGGFCLLDRARGNPLTRKNVNRPASLIRRGGSSVGKRCVAMWVVGGGYRTLPTRRLAASRKASRLTMYGTNSHQRLHHSVDIEGALCPHIMPLALFPPFLARQKGCARRVGASPGGLPPEHNEEHDRGRNPSTSPHELRPRPVFAGRGLFYRLKLGGQVLGPLGLKRGVSRISYGI